MKTMFRQSVILMLILLSVVSLCEAQARKNKQKNRKARPAAKLPGEVIKLVFVMNMFKQ